MSLVFVATPLTILLPTAATSDKNQKADADGRHDDHTDHEDDDVMEMTVLFCPCRDECQTHAIHDLLSSIHHNDLAHEDAGMALHLRTLVVDIASDGPTTLDICLRADENHDIPPPPPLHHGHYHHDHHAPDGLVLSIKVNNSEDRDLGHQRKTFNVRRPQRRRLCEWAAQGLGLLPFVFTVQTKVPHQQMITSSHTLELIVPLRFSGQYISIASQSFD
jgi:hypothetical protein